MRGRFRRPWRAHPGLPLLLVGLLTLGRTVHAEDLRELTDKEAADFAVAPFDKANIGRQHFYLGRLHGTPVRVDFYCSEKCVDEAVRVVRYDILIEKKQHCDDTDGVATQTPLPGSVWPRDFCIPRAVYEAQQLAGARKLTVQEVVDYAAAPFDRWRIPKRHFLLGSLDGTPVQVDFFCSDQCPLYTTRVVHLMPTLGKTCAESGGVETAVSIPVSIARQDQSFCLPKAIAQVKPRPGEARWRGLLGAPH